MKIRFPGSYDADAHSKENVLDTGTECLVKEEFGEDCDINVLVKRFGLTGELPENWRMPQYGDFTGVTDYHTALQLVRDADQGFEQLPSEVKRRFGNDPSALMLFLSDDRNRDEAIKLGLVKVCGRVPFGGEI